VQKKNIPNSAATMTSNAAFVAATLRLVKMRNLALGFHRRPGQGEVGIRRHHERRGWQGQPAISGVDQGGDGEPSAGGLSREGDVRRGGAVVQEGFVGGKGVVDRRRIPPLLAHIDVDGQMCLSQDCVEVLSLLGAHEDLRRLGRFGSAPGPLEVLPTVDVLDITRGPGSRSRGRGGSTA
jgi:hypothetical protein